MYLQLVVITKKEPNLLNLLTEVSCIPVYSFTIMFLMLIPKSLLYQIEHQGVSSFDLLPLLQIVDHSHLTSCRFMMPSHGQMNRQVSIGIFFRLIGSLANQILDSGQMSSTTRHMKWRSPIIRPVRQSRAVFHQKLDNQHVFIQKAGQREGRHAIGIAGVDQRALLLLDEQLHQRQTPPGTRHVQGRGRVFGAVFHERAVLDEKFHYSQMPIQAGQSEGRDAVAILRIHAGAAGDQEFDDRQMAILAGAVEGRLTAGGLIEAVGKA